MVRAESLATKAKQRYAKKRMTVDMYLMGLYQDAAGMLPTKPFG